MRPLMLQAKSVMIASLAQAAARLYQIILRMVLANNVCNGLPAVCKVAMYRHVIPLVALYNADRLESMYSKKDIALRV